MSRHLSIDIETYSSVDITKSGLYKYVQSDDFEILLFAYSVDGGDKPHRLGVRRISAGRNRAGGV